MARKFRLLICAVRIVPSTPKAFASQIENAALTRTKIDNGELNLLTLAQMKIETLAVHAGHTVDPATGAVAAPIYLATTYERDIDGTYSRGFMYTRNNNPNRQALERGVSLLEGGEAAAAFGSGMAGVMALFQALTPGDHVLAHIDAYYGTSRLLREIFLRWGLEADFINMSKPDEVKKALRPQTKLAWAETPSNPLLKIVDLAAVAEIVHQAGALCVCDNTWAPVLQRPFELGADLILYSTTKYFGGHCDVAGGIVVAKHDSDFFQRMRSIQYEGGAIPSPFDCWLILRGMRTLPWRMRAHSENAMKVAGFLARHKKVARVHYPGLQSHSGHSIAAKQMSMFGGMLSFEVKNGRDAAMSVAAKTKIFIRATSLGGVESLIEHRASIEGSGTTSPEGLLRLSIGLENADDLIEDLDQALR
jgi:cystathionine gamma-synthase